MAMWFVKIFLSYFVFHIKKTFLETYLLCIAKHYSDICIMWLCQQRKYPISKFGPVSQREVTLHWTPKAGQTIRSSGAFPTWVCQPSLHFEPQHSSISSCGGCGSYQWRCGTPHKEREITYPLYSPPTNAVGVRVGVGVGGPGTYQSHTLGPVINYMEGGGLQNGKISGLKVHLPMSLWVSMGRYLRIQVTLH